MAILARIRANGGSVVRDRWRFGLKRGRLDARAVAWIHAHIDALKREMWPDYDWWQERAAIREYDGGMSRKDAEAAAWEDVSCSR